MENAIKTKRSLTVEFNGVSFVSSNKLDLAKQLMANGCDYETAFSLVSPKKESKASKSPVVQLKKDLGTIKKAINVLMNSAKSLSGTKNSEEFLRKSLKGLDELNDGVFLGMSRKEKYALIVTGANGFGMAIEEVLLSIRGNLELE